MIATITREIREMRHLPVYVAEASAIEKMKKINSVSYLRHCHRTLSENRAPVFVYGHSAAENDSHIYRAIFTSETPHLYFGVYEPTDAKVAALDGRLAHFQRAARSTTTYSFFDSGSAAVWGEE